MTARRAEEPREPTIEGELQRLEAIVDELAGDGIELDAALRLFEVGVARLRAVSERLGAAESRVKLLSEEADGSFSLDDLDE
ncbi:MAG: exodeoxyribonuclease VII small subunit [Gemmatimonadaceae bacterium]|nr:exodeoxyribonuclease VII small subunit [Gemmatimonadaceae bacterium]NUQ94124.1 exodeoxyribonuclease VII small subunit [Gemmatimonadaceae bacterium]NUR18749.1 exodeoxyribonuclease VII small subunit [Gemmatimonadaceae bacterium]NUS97124.1 exodeoxyribonuclease VII small subunit [Gemmatimonadaceae bacterium]